MYIEIGPLAFQKKNCNEDQPQLSISSICHSDWVLAKLFAQVKDACSKNEEELNEIILDALSVGKKTKKLLCLQKIKTILAFVTTLFKSNPMLFEMMKIV